MVVLKLVGVLACICLVVWAAYAFESSAAQRFNHRFFTVHSISCSMATFTLVLIGYALWATARSRGADEVNGLALMGIGSAFAAGLWLWHVHRTNAAIGSVGALMHASLFGGIGAMGVYAITTSFFVWAFLIAANNVKRGDPEAKEDHFF
jgi:hypothetical protein